MIGVELSFALFFISTFFIVQVFIRPLVDFSLYVIIVAILFFYHSLAVFDAVSGSLLSTNIDSQTFHILASERSSNPLREGYLVFGVDYQIYQSILTIIYWLFNSSRLIGNELSVFVFTFSLLIWVKFLHLLDYAKWSKIFAILFFSLLPSVVIFGVTTLREPWQLLFMLSAVYNGTRYLDNRKSSSLVLFAVSIVALSFMHKAMLVYSILLCLLVVFWSFYGVLSADTLRSKRKDFRVFLVMLLSFSLLLLLFKTSNSNLELYSSLGVLRDIFTGKTLAYLHWTTTTALASKPASVFGSQLDATSWWNLIVSYPLVYFNYMFGPFLWQLDFSDLSLKYIDAFLESILRFFLIIGFFINFFSSSKINRSKLLFLFIIYVSLTSFWALASTNYGQAIRHHMVSGWLIILIGSPGLLRLLDVLRGRVRTLLKYSYKRW